MIVAVVVGGVLGILLALSTLEKSQKKIDKEWREEQIYRDAKIEEERVYRKNKMEEWVHIQEKYLKPDVKLMEERFGGLIKEFDVDNNGLIDLVEGDDFGKLLKLNQGKIVEIDRNYIKQFVQISNYLKTQRTRLQDLFEYLVKGVDEGGFMKEVRVWEVKSIDSKILGVKLSSGWDMEKCKDFVKEVGDMWHCGDINGWMTQSNEGYEEVLRDNAYIFNSLLANSIIMVQSLIKGDMITFYEIYEKLDQLNVFDSKHERDFRGLLGKISTGMDLLNEEVRAMRCEVIDGFGELGGIMEESNTSLQEGLDSVQSTIAAGNIMTSISAYQLYKINRQTKGLR
jgi:hypothetical protein